MLFFFLFQKQKRGKPHSPHYISASSTIPSPLASITSKSFLTSSTETPKHCANSSMVKPGCPSVLHSSIEPAGDSRQATPRRRRRNLNMLNWGCAGNTECCSQTWGFYWEENEVSQVSQYGPWVWLSNIYVGCLYSCRAGWRYFNIFIFILFLLSLVNLWWKRQTEDNFVLSFDWQLAVFIKSCPPQTSLINLCVIVI